MLTYLRRLYWKKTYRPGRIVSRFVAKDVRREVVVVEASQVDAGFISARIRTWNVLYAAENLTQKPPFGEVRRVEIGSLWNWTGPDWGGPVTEGE